MLAAEAVEITHRFGFNVLEEGKFARIEQGLFLIEASFDRRRRQGRRCRRRGVYVWLDVLFARQFGAKFSIAPVEYAQEGTLVDVVDDVSFEPIEAARRVVVDVAALPEAPESVKVLLGEYVLRLDVVDE